MLEIAGPSTSLPARSGAGRCPCCGAAPGCGWWLPCAPILRLLVTAAHASSHGQAFDVAVVELGPDAAAQAAWQHDGAVADADQAADRVADRLEHARTSRFAALGDRDAVPAVGAVAAHRPRCSGTAPCRRRAHAVEQLLLFLVARAPSTRTAYSRCRPNLGCISLLASSPESVNSSRPSVLRSRRPTDCHLPLYRRGRGGTQSGGSADRRA